MSEGGTPLRVLDIHASEIASWPNLVADISERRIQVALIRDVYPKGAIDELVARLDAGEADARLTEVAPQFRIFSLGLALDTASSLEQYLAAAKLSLPEIERVFRDLPSYLHLIPQLLGRMTGGRPIDLPARGADAYNSTTIRRLPAGGQIPPHCEMEQRNRPAYDHLNGLIGSSIMSFYVTLRPPEQGGEAVISTLEWGRVPLSADGRSNAEPLMNEHPAMRFRPEAGDLIIFDGGRLYHRVSAVGGAKTRWTVGGFMAESAARDRVYYWS